MIHHAADCDHRGAGDSTRTAGSRSAGTAKRRLVSLDVVMNNPG
jgi:hypothetical protein